MEALPANALEENLPEDPLSLAAVDGIFYTEHFFPQVATMDPAQCHPEVWQTLENPSYRYVNIQMSRDFAKTSILRSFSSKRIAFARSRAILYIGKSEGHAIRSLKWLLRQAQYNYLYRNTFGIEVDKWGGVEVSFKTPAGTVWVIAAGITGSIRGINTDEGWRPDLIVIDDVADEENASSDVQRKKISDLIHGAVRNSLAPETECPDAKLVILQTPLHKEDHSNVAFRDPQFVSKRFGCWTAATEDALLEMRESSWPERYPSKRLREDKLAAIKMNRGHIFAREKECRLTSPETSAFHGMALQRYDIPPEGMSIAIGVDPVPPPSPVQIEKGLARKDFEAFAVVGRYKANFYVLEYCINRGHLPDWTMNTFVYLLEKWHPRVVAVESYAYQRTLAALFRSIMLKGRYITHIKEIAERRSKYDRIVDPLTAIGAERRLYVRDEHTELIEQWLDYPDVPHEDLLESVAMAVNELNSVIIFDEMLEEEENEIPELEYEGICP